jgi:predicted transcriptional regulator
MQNRSHILELKGFEGAEVFKALASDSRLQIVNLLAAGDMNINELCAACGVAQPTVTRHIQQLELAGLVTSEYMASQQGIQKRCRLNYDRLFISFENLATSDLKMDEVSMPIGLYTLANPSGTCGLANRERIIGFVDIPQSFFDPQRGTAQILWMAGGFVEYIFPCTLPSSAELSRLELMMEVCSEAPNYDLDYPSDITVWINGVDIGTWTCPGDYGGNRGRLNPDWWIEHMTQYGIQKIWSVDTEGSYVDGTKISDVNFNRAMIVPNQPISVRIGVKPDAEHQGGFNLFGNGFGNYAQDLVLRVHYSGKKIAVRHPGAAATLREDSR